MPTGRFVTISSEQIIASGFQGFTTTGLPLSKVHRAVVVVDRKSGPFRFNTTPPEIDGRKGSIDRSGADGSLEGLPKMIFMIWSTPDILNFRLTPLKASEPAIIAVRYEGTQ